ncbi:MAG: transcription initiation factor IIB family protein [Desulfurococcales archaeon]|nr:transcription initiation factor IIB family protein [Desulfurococcales archaeon]
MVYEHSSFTCPECGSKDIIFDYERGEYICMRCGTVIKERVIDVGREWRIFRTDGDSNRKSRTGKPLTNALHDKGLTTTFSPRARGSRRLKKTMRAIYKLQNEIRISKKDKPIVTGLRYLHKYAKELGLPSYVREDAARILRKALQKNNVKKKTIRAFAAASILLACKMHKKAITLKQIARTLGFSERSLWHAEKRILQSVGRIAVRIPDPKDFIPPIINKLGLSSRVQYLAAYLTYLAKKQELSSGRGPIGLAAATVYVASILLDEKRTQQEVAKSCNITDVTIRNRYGDLVENLDIKVYL